MVNDARESDSLSIPRWFVIAKVLVSLLCIMALFVLVAGAVRFLIGGITRVDGPSMEPMLRDGEWIAFEKISYLVRPPQRFDIVEMLDPSRSDFLVKRIVGVPGDTIVLHGGAVLLRSGMKERYLSEPYLDPQSFTAFGYDFSEHTIQLGPDEFFVLGDNRLHSANDSRSFGPLHRQYIIGRVIAPSLPADPRAEDR